MNRFDHMILATVGFAVIWLVMKYVQGLGIIPFAVMPEDVGFWFIFVGWLGAMFPDFDHDWKPFICVDMLVHAGQGSPGVDYS